MTNQLFWTNEYKHTLVGAYYLDEDKMMAGVDGIHIKVEQWNDGKWSFSINDVDCRKYSGEFDTKEQCTGWLERHIDSFEWRMAWTGQFK